ncbi:MAG: hypothetical protein AAF591_06555 [Verrucomicrobiota bacterium]
MDQNYSNRYEEGIALSIQELWDAHEVVQRYLHSRLQGEGRRSGRGAFLDESLGTLELVLFQIETCMPGIEEERGGGAYAESSPHEAVEALSWCELVLERLSEDAAREDSASPLATWLRELAAMHAAISGDIVAAWIIAGEGDDDSAESPLEESRGSRRVEVPPILRGAGELVAT